MNVTGSRNDTEAVGTSFKTIITKLIWNRFCPLRRHAMFTVSKTLKAPKICLKTSIFDWNSPLAFEEKNA